MNRPSFLYKSLLADLRRSSASIPTPLVNELISHFEEALGIKTGREHHDCALRLQKLVNNLDRDYPNVVRSEQFAKAFDNANNEFIRIMLAPHARKTIPLFWDRLNAEFLFYLFMSPKDCDALVGDLEERYKLIHKKFGARRANFWYWSQAIRSVGPIAWQWFKQLVLKPVLAVATWLLTHDLLKDGSLLEWVKNICAELTKRIRG